jgi:4-amino-4-deoxy-L-arabinose transferase-like glycosyltransferase
VAVLGLFLLVGAGLRFHGLGRESLWNDELDSERVSAQPTVAAVVAKTLRGDGHPPTFNLMLHIVQRRRGNSEALLRLPSAICGVLSIVAIFALGRLLYGPAEGLVAAGLLAVLWCPVYYSQEARPYACLLFAVLVAGAFWVALLRRWGAGERASPWLVAGFLSAALAASYLHHFGAGLALLGGGAAVLVARGRSRRAAAAVFALLLAGYGPGLWYLALQKRHAHSWAWIPPPGLYSVGWYLKFLFNESRFVAAAAVAVGLMALVRAWVARRRGMADTGAAERPIGPLPPSLLLALWLAVPFAGAVAVSYLAFPLLTSRNLIVCLPAAYLLLARALAVLASGARLALLAGLALLLLLAHLLVGMRFYRAPEKEQFREAVAKVVAADPEPGPDVVVFGRVFHREYLDYYFARLGSRRRVDLLAGGDESLAAARELLDRARPRRVWLVRGHREVSPAFLAFLRGRYAERGHEALLGADVWRFEPAATIAGP